MPPLYKREAARRDLVQHFVYLAEHAGLTTAEGFLACAEKSFEVLAAHPELGARLTVQSPELAGIRKWHVRDFEDFLVFYLPHRDGITIVRVLRASRDWWTLLGLR